MKIAFLDRDGTINRDYPDAEWRHISEPEILESALEGMRYIQSKGYELIIITNQYTIGEGIITADQYTAFHAKLLDILKTHGISVLDTFFCPHSRSEQCSCRKPKTGMINQALEKYPAIDLVSSFMCGDSLSDQQCAQSAGLRFFGIKSGIHPINNLADLQNHI